MNKSEWIWHNGAMVPWEDAKVHVMTHALHYGSSVFEGIRVYATPEGSRVFRLNAHNKRMLESAKIHRIPMKWSVDDINAACCEVVLKNNLTNGAYIRPLAYRGYGEIGLAPGPDHPVDMAVAAWEWGTYLGEDALEDGVDACISSWQRVAPNTIPALAKAGGNYLSSTLVSLEARDGGYDEGIALSLPEGDVTRVLASAVAHHLAQGLKRHRRYLPTSPRVGRQGEIPRRSALGHALPAFASPRRSSRSPARAR